MPKVSGVKKNLQTMPKVLPKKTKKGHGFCEVPTVHGNLGADGRLARILGGYSHPSPPLAPSLGL